MTIGPLSSSSNARRSNAEPTVISNIQRGAVSIGGKIATFFVKIGASTKHAFHAIGNALSSSRSRGTSMPRASVAPNRYTKEEKNTLLAEARNSTLFQSLPEGDGLNSKEQFNRHARVILSGPRAVSAMREHGVTLTEAVAISMYTDQGYEEINEGIRNGQPSPKIAALRDAFTSGLNKLPSYRNPGDEGKIVHRGASLPESVGLQYQPANIIRELGIMSTTGDETQSFVTNVRSNYIVQIVLKEGSAGRDISMFSAKPDEREVAFPPGSQFKITLRERSDIDHLKEISDDKELLDTANAKHPTTEVMGREFVVNIVMEEC